ncbi:HNH endonuclease [Roseivirga pacifica]|uniref:HNH endonuclease n=1 Tax=Roseivirga pacifica TaxID=1267423 RepID=UPI003BA89EE3
MIYDFSNGLLAELIKEGLLSEIEQRSKFQYEPVIIKDFSRLKKIGESFYAVKGEDIYHMFSYKSSYYTVRYGRLPAYHIADCKTIEEYSGFTFSSQMPVEVYCLDQQKSLGDQNLKLCGNCKASLSLFGFLSGDKAWFEAIIELAGKQTKRGYDNELLRGDGYTKDWKQLSMAVRLRDEMKCQKCRQQFDNSSRYFLEVHHADHDKQNNRGRNLMSLCVKCHSKVDEMHRRNFSSDEGKKKLAGYQRWLGLR